MRTQIRRAGSTAPPLQRWGLKRTAAIALQIAGLVFAHSASLEAQVISGRVIDSENGAGVGLAAILVLDPERTPLLMRAADTTGAFVVDFPAPGEYYLVIERLGYFETESPLIAVAAGGSYAVDFEMRPEPIRLDPLEVAVSNERLEDFLTLEFGVHPATLRGYRAIQGARLEQAKFDAEDNTDLLRKLYIPVSHGSNVCIGSYGAPLPARMGYERTMARAEAAEAVDDPRRQCGAIYVDGLRCRNEHLEEIDMDRVAVVVTLEDAVHLYSRTFDWTFRRGSLADGC